MPRDIVLYIEDIIESTENIFSYVKGLSFTEFERDQKTIDAVIRNFQIIGEAARKLPEELTNNYPDIQWRRIIAMRNLIIHQYFGVEMSVVWATIKDDLPLFQKQIKKLLDEQ